MKKILLVLSAISALACGVAYADTKISGLPPGGLVQSTDTIPATRGGGTYGVNVGTMAAQSSGAVSITGGAVAGSTITGTIPAGTLPNPAPTTKGGVKSLAAVSHFFLTAIGTDGTPAAAQPTCSSLSDSASGCSTVVGTIATQSAASVAITGGAINGTTIGGSTPAAVTGTTITGTTGFVGPLTGNVTGNVSGSSGSTTGNAATVTGLRFPANDTGAASVGLGTGALSSLPASAAYNDTALGYNALSSGAITTAATNNVAVGASALAGNTSGSYNTAVGSSALQSNQGGGGNVAIGAYAVGTASGAYDNMGIGTNALGSTTGSFNIGIGNQAGFYLGSGASNTAIGNSALNGTSGSAITGANNTAIGDSALFAAITSANDNTAIGQSAGSLITTGVANTILGQGVASTTLTTGNNNILIGTGSGVDAPSSGASNTLNIGNAITGTGLNATPALATPGTLAINGGNLTTTAPTGNGPGTVTVTATGTTVTGSGTSFLSWFRPGQTITANSETHQISTVNSDTIMVTDAWTGAASGVTYALAGTGTQLRVAQNGTIYIDGSTSPISSTNQAAAGLLASPSFATSLQGGQSYRGVDTEPTFLGTGGTGVILNGIWDVPTILAGTTNPPSTMRGMNVIPTIQSGAAGALGTEIGINVAPGNSSASLAVTNMYGIIDTPTQTNTAPITNEAGIAFGSPPSTATNSTYVLIGTTTIPSGNYGIYSTTTAPSQLAGGLTLQSFLTLANTVVGSLPTCNSGSKYQVYAVSDATAPTYGATLVGGGAVATIAMCNGTNWTAH